MTRTLDSIRLDRRQLVTGAAATAATLPLGQRRPVAASTGKHAVAAMSAQGFPAGTGLVTSVRLPLAGIGSGQITSLLDGTVSDWRAVGCPVALPVTVLGLDGVTAEEITPAETLPDYAALVEKLRETPGGVALVPLDQVDLQVSVLAIDGDSPLLTAGTEETPMTRIGFGGDILFGRNVGIHMRTYNDFTFPMLQLKDLLASFDLTICNWECFVSTTIEPPELTDPNTYDFVTVPEAIEGVLMSGVDAVSMANNHAFDNYLGLGPEAYRETAQHLDDAGLPRFGAGENLEEARKPFTTEVNGVRIAILGVDAVTANVDFPGVWGSDKTSATENGPGTNPLILDNVTADIEQLSQEHDVVIPFFHMGQEYLWTPRQFAVDVTRACIDAGASAVVTSHPHTIMGMEVYQGKPIFHAIGNLVYDQMFALDTRTGYILDLTLKGTDVVNFRLHGFENFDFCQGRLLPAGENAALLNRFWRSTDLIQKYRS
jgi:poly-gamma-glutamate synthesis protein (capsule biosynthesis protein)